jgi:hypothetical protein
MAPAMDLFKTKYTRTAPSPRYRRLIEQYQLMHLHGETHLGIPPEQTFPGHSLPKQAPHIKRLIKRTGSKSILDYGSGKGQQYWPLRIVDSEDGIDYPDIKSYWAVEQVRCYDPAYSPFSEMPNGRYDGVICTDVLEHCPEEDIPWILRELFRFAKKFVYANIACFPARKRLPSGGNAHCTIKPVNWWKEQIDSAARSSPGLLYEFRLAHIKNEQLKERTIASPELTASP